MDALKNLHVDRWWKLMAAAGALIAVASAPVSFVAGFLIGLGLLLFGVGEWSMVHKRTRSSPEARHWALVREPRPFGYALEAAGVMLFALGLYKLI